MLGYPPSSVTAPAEIGEVFRMWGSGFSVAELFPTGVGELSDSRGCRGLEVTRSPLFGVVRCLGIGPETFSPRGCI